MKEEHDLTMLFISHDLAVIRAVCDRVAVMYLGKICEMGDVDDLFTHPAHPYTQALLDAVPNPDVTARQPLQVAGPDDAGSPVSPPSGCRFRLRCPKAEARCADEEPEMRPAGNGHTVACHFPERWAGWRGYWAGN
jgi:peptide/nickel transport system ATP-binding protein